MRIRLQKQEWESIALRFISCLPNSELCPQRIGLHFEKAYFYYVDSHQMTIKFKDYERRKQTTQFCDILLSYLKHVEELQELDGKQINNYITNLYDTIQVNGAILMNENRDKVLIVQSSDNEMWGFPKGKVNEGESGIQCAKRQIFEEIKIKVEFLSAIPIQSKGNTLGFRKNIYFYIAEIQEKIVNDSIKKIKDSKQNMAEIAEIKWHSIDQQPQDFNKASRDAFQKFMKKKSQIPKLQQSDQTSNETRFSSEKNSMGSLTDLENELTATPKIKYRQKREKQTGRNQKESTKDYQKVEGEKIIGEKKINYKSKQKTNKQIESKGKQCDKQKESRKKQREKKKINEFQEKQKGEMVDSQSIEEFKSETKTKCGKKLYYIEKQAAFQENQRIKHFSKNQNLKEKTIKYTEKQTKHSQNSKLMHKDDTKKQYREKDAVMPLMKQIESFNQKPKPKYIEKKRS